MDEREWLECFAVTLCELMSEYGLTQGDLAQMIHVPESTVSGYMTKKRMPSLKAVIEIAYLFHVSIDDLVDYGGPIN